VKAKAIFFTIGLLALTAAGYFAYHSFIKVDKAVLWDFIPENSIAVYQIGDCNECVDSLSQVTWLVLIREAYLKDYNLDTALLSSFLKLSESIDAVSLHKTAKHKFDFIFYGSEKFIKSDLLGSISKQGKSRERQYNGVVIKELVLGLNIVTWVELDSYVSISLSPVLIEDVVRAYQLKTDKNFTDKVRQVASLPVVKNDGGNALVDLQAFSDWMHLFTKQEIKAGVGIKGSALLDVKRRGKSIILNGFSDCDSTQKSSLLNIFKSQSPVAFGLKRFVSNDAHFVTNFGFSDPVLFGKNLQIVLDKNDKSMLSKKLEISEAEIKQFYNGLGREIGLQSLESSGQRSSSAVMIDLKSDDSVMRLLDKLSVSLSDDSVFVENYASHLIKRLDKPGFIELLLPIISLEYDELYYSQSGNVLLLGSDISILKKILSDIEEENVWAKSLDKNRFLESTFLESNISFYVDPAPYLKLRLASLSDEWRPFFVRNDAYVSSLGLSALQFSHLNNNFYTNIHLGFEDLKKKNEVDQVKEVIVNVNGAPVHNFFTFRNHNDKSHEVLVQDSSGTIYLLSAGGKILWNKKLNGLIKGEPEQIDYFSNGKLQMLIATDKQIHVIDRLGNYVNPYPIEGLSNTMFIKSVDYDHSRNYRFITADKTGVLTMINKEGQLLDGWKNLSTGGELLATPRHYRIAAKDYVTVVQSVGKFILYNRKGELLKGFPADLKGRVRAEYYLEMDKGRAAFVFVTIDGQKVKIDLTGNELSRETLVKPVFETRFRLITEVSEKSYVVVRQDNKSLALLDKSGNEILSNDFIGMDKTEVKFYDFGSGNIYYTILDVDQDLGYVYNTDGKLMTTQPLDCENLKLYWSKSGLNTVISYEGSVKISNLN
jgi:hypothetical protein